MNKKDKRRHRYKKKKITVNKEYTKDEADVRVLLKSRQNVEKDCDSDGGVDFFCQLFPESKNLENSEDSNTRESTPNLPEIPAIQLASSYVNIEDLSPICPAQGLNISKDADLLFFPSKDELLTETKYANSSVELAVQEGLYVEDFQNLKTNNLNRLVNRFAEEEYEGDLQDIAKIVSLSDNQNYKGVTCAEFIPVYYPPETCGHQNNFIVEKCVFMVTIKELHFNSHPQFVEENRVALKLEGYFRTYVDKVNQNGVEKLTSQLKTTRNIVDNYLKNPESDVKKLEAYVAQVKNLRNSLHTEERTLKLATMDCLVTWKSLKSIREKQGHSRTSQKLVIKVIETDIESARKKWTKRFEIELNEIIRESFEAYYKNKKRVQRNHATPSLSKPNIEVIRSELNEIFENDLVSPDEPKLTLELSKTDVSKDALKNGKEYFVKVFFDQKLVGCTKYKKIPSDFRLTIEETFAIYLDSRIPEDIKFEIYEKSNLHPDVKIVKIFSSIPSIEYSKVQQNLNFCSQKHSMSGNLNVSLIYDNKNPTNLNDNSNQTSQSHQTRTKVKISRNVLRTWYNNQLINPLDSDCGSILDAIKNTPENETNLSSLDEAKDESSGFTFNEDLYTFCSEEDFHNDKRFRILAARYRNELKFKDRRFIPMSDKELEEEAPGKAIEDIEWMDPIDIDKHKGKKYVKSLYQVVLNHCEKLNRNEDASNLLTGDEAPTFSSIVSSLLGIFGPARPLNPSKSSPVNLNPSNCSNFNLIINIVRATGVPFRNFRSTISRRDSDTSTTYQAVKPSNVKPYVAVRCKDKFLRTISAEGSNPTWNEQLILQLSRDSFESKDEISFQLYDEYVEDLLGGEISRATEVYQRIHTNWLGELKFPLNTIFSKQQIDGVFELASPVILLGYTKPSLDSNKDTITVENLPEIKKAVYLSLYINVEPQFEIPHTTMAHLVCSELKELKAYIQEVCIQVKYTFPDRFIDPLISLVNGKRSCITRLLEPIPLPFENNEDCETMIRRYVSLFPTFRTTSSCLGLHGIWFNNQIILDSSWASPKDLGVLLCCFYLSLEIPAGLVLGIGYPHGETTFVLLKESSEYLLVDPSTGRKYSTNDTFCPLVKVFCIVSEENVYFNFQTEMRVSMTDFNLDNQSNWFPLFNKKHLAPNGEIHKLNYRYRQPYDTVNLQKTIERKIVKKINAWRSNRKTVWNRAFQDTLFNVLIELERDAVFDRDENVYLDRITQNYPNYKIFGFTINLTYTNLSTIADRIKATGIHLNIDKNVEFSLAVYIQQYPNNILSVWIFIISVVPVNVIN